MFAVHPVLRLSATCFCLFSEAVLAQADRVRHFENTDHLFGGNSGSFERTQNNGGKDVASIVLRDPSLTKTICNLDGSTRGDFLKSRMAREPRTY
jgi:hypothetical protein